MLFLHYNKFDFSNPWGDYHQNRSLSATFFFGRMQWSCIKTSLWVEVSHLTPTPIIKTMTILERSFNSGTPKLAWVPLWVEVVFDKKMSRVRPLKPDPYTQYGLPWENVPSEICTLLVMTSLRGRVLRVPSAVQRSKTWHFIEKTIQIRPLPAIHGTNWENNYNKSVRSRRIETGAGVSGQTLVSAWSDAVSAYPSNELYLSQPNLSGALSYQNWKRTNNYKRVWCIIEKIGTP